jgi:hypothetical protein
VKRSLTPTEQAWIKTSQRRLCELLTGKVREVPGDEVSARARALLNSKLDLLNKKLASASRKLRALNKAVKGKSRTRSPLRK